MFGDVYRLGVISSKLLSGTVNGEWRLRLLTVLLFSRLRRRLIKQQWLERSALICHSHILKL